MKAPIVVALAVVLAGGVAAPAQAAWDTTSRGCVTRAEFRQIGKGDPKWWVADAFGTSGKQTSVYWGYSGRYETRDYKGCGSRYSSVMVSFYKGKVQSKYAIWM